MVSLLKIVKANETGQLPLLLSFASPNKSIITESDVLTGVVFLIN